MNELTIQIPEGKEAKFTDKGIEWVDKETDLDFCPNYGDGYYHVLGNGGIDALLFEGDEVDEKYKRQHNMFPDRQMAEKAAKLQTRANAYVRAALLVDPDFGPDWGNSNQEKIGVYYHQLNNKHYFCSPNEADDFAVYVSSREKAKQMIKLLEKWGVK